MVDKQKKSTKKGLHSPHIDNLTKVQEEILRLYTEEHLTVNQIRIKRKCSKQAVYKHLRSLKRKGAYNLGLQKTEKVIGSRQPNEKNGNQVRLHGQEFHIKIIQQEPSDQKYQKLLKKSDILYISGHTIKLYRDSIEIYAGGGTSFYGNDAQEADRKASEYWQKFFTRMEHELNVILVKGRSRNIKEVNHHYARGESEICRNTLEKEGRHIRLFCPRDGKLAFITDESFGDKEDETVHPITAKQDRGAIDKQVNDWRLNDPPTLSEIMHLMKEHVELNKETAAGLLTITNYLMPPISKLQNRTKSNNFPDKLSYIM